MVLTSFFMYKTWNEPSCSLIKALYHLAQQRASDSFNKTFIWLYWDTCFVQFFLPLVPYLFIFINDNKTVYFSVCTWVWKWFAPYLCFTMFCAPGGQPFWTASMSFLVLWFLESSISQKYQRRMVRQEEWGYSQCFPSQAVSWQQLHSSVKSHSHKLTWHPSKEFSIFVALTTS